MSTFKKIDKAIVKLLECFLILTIIIMVAFIVWQVIGRYLLHISTAYAEENSRLSLVWCIFIGGALATRKEEHIYVNRTLSKGQEKEKHYYRIANNYANLLLNS